MPPELDAAAAALVTRLLVRSPAERLGTGEAGSANVMADPFWLPLTFEGVRNRQYTPTYVPPTEAEREAAKAAKLEAERAAKEARNEAEVEEGSDIDDESDIEDESDDDFSEDEWHVRASPGGDNVPEMIRGWTFRREKSFVPKPQADGPQLTRSMTLKQGGRQASFNPRGSTMLARSIGSEISAVIEEAE